MLPSISDADAPRRVLGAIMAGGRARRFGSDKALALIDGQPVIAHVHSALQQQTTDVILCGRDWNGLRSLADRPEGGLGPLAGLNAALAHGLASGFDLVLAVPVDVLPLPADLVERLARPPSVLARQRSIGLWPAQLAPLLDAHLAAGHRSFASWIARSGAVQVDDAALGLHNINRPEDLAAVLASRRARPPRF